jgi:hypothetical protein
MSQSRRQSLFEQLINQIGGFVLAMIVWEWVISPSWGFNTSYVDNLGITLIYTTMSIIRGYLVRRLFNWYTHRNV